MCTETGGSAHLWCYDVLTPRAGRPATLLRVERLRYLRQLSQAAPDTLWALVRHDTAYLNELREAMRWLYRRVSGTVPLQDPFLSWAEWERVMCKAPAVSGDGSSMQPHLRRSACVPLQPFSLAGVTLPPSARRSVLSRSMEFGSLMHACLAAKLLWIGSLGPAMQASCMMLHGYRTRATELTRGVDQSWCSGCGKLFANPDRMKRHVFVTPACQEKWGTFRLELDGSLPKHPLHPSAPPLQLPDPKPFRRRHPGTMSPSALGGAPRFGGF